MREASTHSRRSPSQLTSFQALEQSGAAVIVVDTAGQVQHWSQAASELYGWTPKQAQGRRLIELIREQYPYAEDQNLAQAALGARASWSGVVVQHHRNGRPLWVLSSRRADDTVPGCVLITNQQLPEWARAILEQASNNDRAGAPEELAQILEITDIALSHLDLDSLLRELLTRIRAAVGCDTAAILLREEGGENMVVRAALGLDVEALRHMRVPVGQGFAGQIAARRRSLMAEDLTSYLTTSPVLREAGARSALGVPLVVGDQAIGVLHVGSLRERNFTEADVRLLQLVADRAGRAIDHARLDADLLARERHLEDAHALLDTIFATAPVGFAFWDTALHYVRVNDALAAIHGVPARDYLGRRIGELAPEIEHTVEGLLRQVLATGEPVIDQEMAWEELQQRAEGGDENGNSYLTRHASGLKARHWLASYYPVRSGTDALIGVGGIVLEITARKRLEAQLLQAQKMESIGRLAGGIAHDFNNVLTAIAGYTELLIEELEDRVMKPDEEAGAHSSASLPSSVLQDLQEVRKAAQSASVLTRQLLAFARKQQLTPEVVDLNALVAGMQGMLGRLIGEDITLTIRPAVRLRPVKGDKGQIEQVIVNLVVNARDAMPTGGTLTIETANVTLDGRYDETHPGVKTGPYVMLAISDTGAGMDADIQARAFEPFFTTKAPGEGTGLGLATCYGIVKQHSGAIWIYSEVGRGTAVKVYLPPASEQVLASAQPPVAAALPTGSETVLLAEDNLSVRALAARVLRAQGYTVLEAENGQEAVRLASAYIPARIDLLVTDVVMPRLSGADLAHELRRLYPEVVVLYTSGYPNAAVTQHGAFAEEPLLLQKPFAPRALAMKVREVLDAASDDRGLAAAEQ